MELHVRGVSHRYGDLHALDAIDLVVHERETVALIGPSGCGKSTLLGIMGGLLEPTDGRVEALGAPPDGCLNPYTYIFQDFALLPWRTVGANVGLPLEHHPLSKNERADRIGHALSLTGLTDFAEAYPRQLSGGMRQRVGIARAIAVAPAVLLLDEPLSALDAQTRELLLEDLIDIWAREHTTSVYVTHNLDEALRIADRVVVLSRRPGRIKEILEIDLPLAERSKAGNADLMISLHENLWSLIRDEAADADREMAHA